MIRDRLGRGISGELVVKMLGDDFGFGPIVLLTQVGRDPALFGDIDNRHRFSLVA